MAKGPRRAPKVSRPTSPISNDDTESVVSEIYEFAGSLSVQDTAASLETALDKLHDRRAKTRVESLVSLNRELSLQLHHDFLVEEMPGIQAGLIACLKRNSSDEIVEACRLLMLITITIGTDADPFLKQAIPILKRLSHHGGSNVQSAALRALATIQLITCQHLDEIWHWLGAFSKFFRRADPAIAVAAIKSWALLATQLSSKDLARSGSKRFQRKLASLLHSKSIDVRSAAGEALALLFEAKWDLKFDEESGADEPSSSEADELSSEDESDGDEYIQGSTYKEDNPDDHDLESDDDIADDELSELISQLSTEGSRVRGKKELSQQRSVFRSVFMTIESGTKPKTILKIGKDRLTFGTWRTIIRLSAMRDALSQGLYRHISCNDMLREILLIPKTGGIGSDCEELIVDMVAVHLHDKGQSTTKQRKQKLMADRTIKHSFRFESE